MSPLPPDERLDLDQIVHLAVCMSIQLEFDDIEEREAEVKQQLEALIEERERQAIDRYIAPHIRACEEMNGLSICKNCGLSPQDL